MKFHEWFAASLVVLVGSVAFLSLFSYTGSLAYETFWQDERLERETQIAGVDVSEMSEDEAVTAVQAELDQWENQATVSLVWYDEKRTLSNETFSFDVDESVERMFAGEGRTEGLSVSVNEQDIREHLSEFSFTDNPDDRIDVETLTAELEERVSQLPVEDLEKNVHLYLYAEEQPEETIVASTQRQLPADQQGIAGTIGTVEIPPGAAFSMLDVLDENGPGTESSDELAVIASVVYETLLHSNFEILERSQRYELLDEVPLGFDAAVVPGQRDLVFRNPNADTYELEINEQNGSVEASLYGLPFPYDIRVSVEEMAEIEPKTKVRFSSSRAEGDREVISEGHPGYHIRTVRHISLQNVQDTEEREEVVSEDYYPPENRLEEWSIEERYKEEEEPEEEWQDPNGDTDPDGQNGWDPNGNGQDPDDWDPNGGTDPDEHNGWDPNGDWQDDNGGQWQDGSENDWQNGENGSSGQDQNGSGWQPGDSPGSDNGGTAPGQDEESDFTQPGTGGNGENGTGPGDSGTTGQGGDGPGTGTGGLAPPAGDDEEDEEEELPIKGH
ncbi:hypothetical protein CR205_01630 [Alteribacter lacisalsi]|uniref:G5 domain-containing protein n=1 Tax=Alteribacter lacisalsi TaxID=2045244 RepID=A0A2W0HBD0_9BACI|nr:VanW family protein [Alteribacter lacisalsi]PYZ97330.1 hypothetical protein CR205_01630 [Alteribacter lacisalsi]